MLDTRFPDQARERYIVQWVTEFDYNNHLTKVVGYCVRDTDDTQWATLFRHKDYGVCEKICQILNEKELTNVRGT